MEFIPATEAHYPAIGDLVKTPEELYLIFPVGKFPWDTEQLNALAAKRSDFTVGIQNNTIMAFANLYDVVPNKSAFLGNIIVSEEARGTGTGKALTQHMMQIARDKHNAVPHLSVFGFNTRAVLLYASLGFRPYAVEERQNLSGEKVALFHMRCDD